MGLLSKCYKAGLVRSKKYFHQRKCLLLAEELNVTQPLLPKKCSKGSLYHDLRETLTVMQFGLNSKILHSNFLYLHLNEKYRFILNT